MADLQKLEELRPCGRLEIYSTSRHELEYYHNVGLTATYSATTPPSVSLQDLVYAALAEVIAKHPFLSAIPLNEDKQYPDVYFARLPTVDLRRCVDFRERNRTLAKDATRDPELDAVLVDQHSRSYKDDLGTKPFWRLTILTCPDSSTFTAAWFFHHALGDGGSGPLFHDTFLEGLNAAATNTILKVNSMIESPSTPLPPPFEEQHPMGISWGYFIKSIAAFLVPSIFDARPAKLWTGTPTPTQISREFHYETIFLTAENTQRLAQISRKEKTSVQAVLACLFAGCLFANLPADEVELVKIAGPISMRRFIDVPETQMTNAVGTYTYTHERTKSLWKDQKSGSGTLKYFNWDESRAVKAFIEAEVAKKGYDNSVALLKYVSDMHKQFTGTAGKPRMATSEISNLGVYKKKPAKEGDTWSIGRMTFSQCASAVACPFAVSVITGADGCASLCWGWRTGGAEEELIRAVREGVEQGVGDLIDGYEK